MMIKIRLIVLGMLLFLPLFLYPVESETKMKGRDEQLFTENGQPSDSLLQLLKVVGMADLHGTESLWTQINCWAQGHILRSGERWDVQTRKFDVLTPTLIPLLTELGFVDAVVPQTRYYQGAIVHGSVLSKVRLRLYYLVEQWKAGVRFKDLYFLSGERPLLDRYEDRYALTHEDESPLKIRADWEVPSILPRMEYEMVQWVWNQSDIPEDLRKQVVVHFINAPRKCDPKQRQFLRPTTEDTAEKWLEASPPHGRYLAVSNAPYTMRQDMVMRLNPSMDGYEFDTIGPAAYSNERIVIYLDELARLIYEFNRSKTLQ